MHTARSFRIPLRVLLAASLSIVISITMSVGANESTSTTATMRFDNTHRQIADRYGRLQLVVTQQQPSGGTSDVTGKVAYEASPAGIVSIDAEGSVTPLASGKVMITARDSTGRQAVTEVAVGDFTSEPPGFDDRIMPILTKYNCNTCHGKPGGRNGFRLSLFGFDPPADHVAFVKESRGRRVLHAVPEQSLMLRKATQTVPHGGGMRFETDSHAYRTVRDWIAGGTPRGTRTDVSVDRVELLPKHRVLEPTCRQQLCVVAHFSDGTTADVTHLAVYRANGTMAEVDAQGVVTTQDRRGEFAIVALYGGQADVFRGAIPFGHSVAKLPEPRNFVDQAVFAKWRSLGIPPSDACDDSTFLRRVTIDLAGRLPNVEETRDFLGDQDADKRDRCIDRLLDSTDHADYFANKWMLLLRNYQGGPESARGTYSFHHWIRDSLRENKPYDQFVREIITAAGDVTQHPPANWFRELRDVESRVENMSQVFLGVRITCARCHHHPFEKWSQSDYYSLAAFFVRTEKKRTLEGNPHYYEQRIYHKRGLATYKHPLTGAILKPAGLGGEPLEIDPDDDPRFQLADWMADEKNPFFATVLVNRYWKHFFGRGVVEPEDDLRDTNPPSNPELLAGLRRRFIESGYDMKGLLRSICRSRTYQLSFQANAKNIDDSQCFSWFYPRRVNAEVLLDSMDDLLAANTQFRSMPPGMRAVQLPDTTGQHEMLELFGQPKAQTPCECERSQAGDLRQSLYMLTSPTILTKLSSSTGRAANLAKDQNRSLDELVDEIYLRAFCREPRPQERAIAVAHLREHGDRKKALENLLWSIVKTKEFLYNH